ncbi:MAG: cysteine--tRNA ligase [Clostridiales bacterium]|nr:cysteine--tRNA ligase [Clostridiales bacterium]
MKLYNTKTRRKEDFTPLSEGKVGMYCCGPTVYNYIHLGNTRPLVVFDTIRRYLIWRGFEVTFVQNFTDVDDKIIRRATEENISIKALTEKYITAFFEDTKTLNVLPADVHPRVSSHMPEIVSMIEAIIAHGHAYEVEGDVYFDVRSFPAYGELSGRDIDDMRSGARVLPGETKHDPLDFALWKAAKPNEPAWESPWGLGRPGWHIECSAMSCKYLGADFDIHGGGADLVFPHHENEIAQSRSATNAGFARYWLHNGFITVDQEKMSKSLGNFFLLREILTKFSGDVVRFYLLSTHYRSPIDFADDKLAVAAKSLARIQNSLLLLEEAKARATDSPPCLTECCQKTREEFIAAMDDDFNTALAISAIFTFCHELNSYLNREVPPARADIETVVQLFADFEAVLGMITPQAKETGGLEEPLLELLLKMREQVRAKKDWATADAIRDGLKELGIVIEDTLQGTRWKKDS